MYKCAYRPNLKYQDKKQRIPKQQKSDYPTFRIVSVRFHKVGLSFIDSSKISFQGAPPSLTISHSLSQYGKLSRRRISGAPTTQSCDSLVERRKHTVQALMGIMRQPFRVQYTSTTAVTLREGGSWPAPRPLCHSLEVPLPRSHHTSLLPTHHSSPGSTMDH